MPLFFFTHYIDKNEERIRSIRTSTERSILLKTDEEIKRWEDDVISRAEHDVQGYADRRIYFLSLQQCDDYNYRVYWREE